MLCNCAINVDGGGDGHMTDLGSGTGGNGRMCRVVTLPSDDAEFSDDVRAALAKTDHSAESSQALLVALLEELLPRYPNMEISQQDGLASYLPDPDTMYVYRHGPAQSPSEPDVAEIE
jgi:hypothetical protein